MRYHLRTLLIVLALGPALLAASVWVARLAITPPYGNSNCQFGVSASTNSVINPTDGQADMTDEP